MVNGSTPSTLSRDLHGISELAIQDGTQKDSDASAQCSNLDGLGVGNLMGLMT